MCFAKTKVTRFYQDENNKWRWRRTSTDGKITVESTEAFENENDCMENAKNSMEDDCVFLRFMMQDDIMNKSDYSLNKFYTGKSYCGDCEAGKQIPDESDLIRQWAMKAESDRSVVCALVLVNNDDINKEIKKLAEIFERRFACVSGGRYNGYRIYKAKIIYCVGKNSFEVKGDTEIRPDDVTADVSDFIKSKFRECWEALA